MKFLKKLLLAIILLPCTFMFTACLSTEPNVYLVDVVFESVGDETIFTYIYSNGYKKTKTIKNQSEPTKSIVDISKSDTDDTKFVIKYSDNSTSEITINSDNTNSIINFELKKDSDDTYVITYKNGDKDEIKIENTEINAVVGIQKTEGNNNKYTISFSDGSTSEISIDDDNVNSVVAFEKIDETTYIIRYEDGTSEEVTIIADNITAEKYYENKVIETYSQVANSSVLIHSSITNDEDHVNTGSGFIYSMNKSNGGKSYIITNHHVVEDNLTANGIAETIKIFPFGSSSGLTATYIGSSASIDVAVVEVNTQDLLTLNEYCYTPKIAEDRVLGDTAIAVGNPNAQGLTITSGRVSLEKTYKIFDETETKRQVFGLDTPLNPGNSGGGIYNLDGEVIGICEGGSIELQNIAYAIPIELVDAVAKNIIDQHNLSSTNTQAKRIKLGISVLDTNSRAEKDNNNITRIISDVNITEIDATGIAYKKFNLRQNDIITSININGTKYKINRIFDIDVYLLSIRSGDNVSFDYTRDGINKTSTLYSVQDSNLFVIE